MPFYVTVFLCLFFLVPAQGFAATIFTVPEKPIQGDPVLISVDTSNATSTVSDTVTSIMWNTKKLSIFVSKEKVSALYGVDLYTKPGMYTVTMQFKSGATASKKVEVQKRDRIVAPLGIPEKLGGNTEKAATTLVSTLAKENASLLGLRTGTHAFWTKPFSYPTVKPFITDEYGYSRQTGSYSIAHKGTDFRAAVGDSVLAMNRGVVRLVQEGRNYGKTIIIDHGLGIQTFYMHLSKISVQEGQLVLPGQVIGLAGMTGYAEQPHLHLSVRINEISIDPMRFVAIMQ